MTIRRLNHGRIFSPWFQVVMNHIRCSSAANKGHVRGIEYEVIVTWNWPVEKIKTKKTVIGLCVEPGRSRICWRRDEPERRWSGGGGALRRGQSVFPVQHADGRPSLLRRQQALPDEAGPRRDRRPTPGGTWRPPKTEQRYQGWTDRRHDHRRQPALGRKLRLY